ncbi:hypothetical protein SERLA73DRAFT_188231 [Serpula lacrymans var. lacrymans S7.3]|uniref:Glutamine amidotransferase domain-containing protein n=2 Tax=Serpula lacrymans var. lacrymans TaxID=341189 RepID=F8QAZ4_SERL3|nr:uncharacterized protein SERLADRAFT_478273 [Serpula lacrymans var. lacrymans S7.9]EGN94380.1 hypothetical protein SERLA73DRAFT_188231 [Serpula lacrymans var. lacrymans S7.3]EGO19863.1 hypothetical protein SERLADRAFT_478273 [Serpula lacrymans var. lacrymans S7.9]
MTRIALLICDTPALSVRKKHGDYIQVYNDYLRNSLPRPELVSQLNVDSYDVVDKQEYPDDDISYDAVVMTGSAASAYQNLEWINKLIAYVKRLVEEKPEVKIFGICFGHQIVARAVGGECVPTDGLWEIGVTEMQLTDVGKKVFGVDSINIQQMHRDHVPAVPPSFHLLGSTDITMNHGMVRFSPSSPSANPVSLSLKDIQILTIQGHPEFTESIVKLVVDDRSGRGVISPEVAEEARRRASLQNDGVSIVGKTLWGILGVA